MVKRTPFNVITFGRNKIIPYGLEFETVSKYRFTLERRSNFRTHYFYT